MSKIKLLAVGDDLRHYSGMGLQLKKVLHGLRDTGRYSISEIACSNVPYPKDVVLHDGIRLHPTRDYGHMDDIRRVMMLEQPRVLLALGDPRQFTELFMLDAEIRPNCKFILWHVWDNDPFPKFNAPLYAATDRLVTFSNFSHKLLGDGGYANDAVVCSVDKREFFTLPEAQREAGRKALFAQVNQPVKFLVFWNSRNGSRKRLADMVLAFKRFWKLRPDSMLFCNTDARDREGTDIMKVVAEVEPCDANIAFNFERTPTEQLNLMYNLADVTVSISFWEGFGLSVAESLAAGTPVIVNCTGGMTEQVNTKWGEAGIALQPIARNLHGTLEVPYIYMDFVSVDQVVDALVKMHDMSREQRQDLGDRGQRHMLDHFNVENMVEKFDEIITQESEAPITFKSWEVQTI